MLCPNCHQEFNQTVNLPRILVFCGHTFCNTCLESLLILDPSTSKQSLNCPECNVTNIASDGVNSFPKNLVLLQVASPQQQQSSSLTNLTQAPIQQTNLQPQSKQDYNNSELSSRAKDNQPASSASSSATIIQSRDNQKSNNNLQNTNASAKLMCQDHNKKLEAFCEKDLQVLCIDCILSDQHKSHEIISVQKAVEKQKQTMYDEVSQAQNNEERLKFLSSDIKRHINDMQAQADRNRKELSQIYSFVRELILEREQALKRQISDNLTREEQECQAKLAEIGDFITQISNLKQELVLQSQEQEIEVLSKSKGRIALSQEVNGQKAKDLVLYNLLQISLGHQSLLEIKRDQELAQISKIVHPGFKGSVTSGGQNAQSQGSFGQQNQQNNCGGVGSSLYSHTLSTANKMKRGHTTVEKGLAGVQQQQNQLAPQGINNSNTAVAGCQGVVQNMMNGGAGAISGTCVSNQNSQTNIDTKLVKDKDDYNVKGGVAISQSSGVNKSSNKNGVNKGGKAATSPHRNTRKTTMEGNSKKEGGVKGNNGGGAGVVVLDQKQGKSNNKQYIQQKQQQQQQQQCYGTFSNYMGEQANGSAQQNVNVYNFNQAHHFLQGKDVTNNYYYDKNGNQQQDELSEDMIGGGGPILGNCADDVSSIYPVDTLECYFNYSPKNSGFNKQMSAANSQQTSSAFQNQRKTGSTGNHKNNDSGHNLNDLLESLNKSTSQDINMRSSDGKGQILKRDKKTGLERESSTASETGGSTNNGDQQKQKNMMRSPIDQKSKEHIETPKTGGGNGNARVNQWKVNQQQQKDKSAKKKALKKENSVGEFEEFKNLQCKIQSPLKNDGFMKGGAVGEWTPGTDNNIYSQAASIDRANTFNQRGTSNSNLRGCGATNESGTEIQRSGSLNRFSHQSNKWSNSKQDNGPFQKKKTQNNHYYYNGVDQFNKNNNLGNNEYDNDEQHRGISNFIEENIDDDQDYLQVRQRSQSQEKKKQFQQNQQQVSDSKTKQAIMPTKMGKGSSYFPVNDGISSSNQSPLKQDDQKLDEERQQLMVMLQECSKNIEKIEFRPSAKKTGKESSNSQSPVKNNGFPSSHQKQTTVCLVDLTMKEADEEDKDESMTNTLQNQESGTPAINKEDEMEEPTYKRLPNMSAQKENSPFKERKSLLGKGINLNKEVFSIRQDNTELTGGAADGEEDIVDMQQQDSRNKIQDIIEERKSFQKQLQSPTKMICLMDSPIKSCSIDMQSQQSMEESQLMLNCSKSQFTSLGASCNQNNINNNSISAVDTSINDPFRALGRIKEEFIFVFSGFNDQKLFSCECLDVARGVWKETAVIGRPRTKFGAVPISKSRILLFGGKQTDGQRSGEIEEYNLKTNKFKTLPFKMPKARSGFAACVKREEGKIFFCGGNSGTVLRKFDCLDLKKGKWSKLAEMIQKRDELAVALGPDGKIYAIGGYGGGANSITTTTNTMGDEAAGNGEKTEQKSQSNCLRTAERYDFTTGQWEMLPDMNEARRALACVALPDGIYAIGGYDGKQYLDSVEKYDLQKQCWIPIKSMQKSRCTLSAVTSADFQYIYALGGFNGASLDLVERYDIMSDKWELTTPMISKRFMHQSVSLVTH